MMILRDPASMRAWSLDQRSRGKTIGLVPTMGALHEGHASLMRAAVRDNDVTVLSIFVNPTQFGPNEDLDQYPRTFDADREMADGIGVAAIYFPTVESMYPKGYATYVSVERLTERLCGASRPTHFRGVTTVVSKLFNAVMPDRAYFGQKDAQQCAVVRRMTRDLDFGIEIIEVPIVREEDGLAMSSRNRYLDADERRRALALSQALEEGRKALDAGERDPERVLEAVRARLEAEGGLDLDYAELVDADEIVPLDRVRGRVLLAVAARLGKTRLIDNIQYEVPE
jgi:pantoate--beta-alanine ligase